MQLQQISFEAILDEATVSRLIKDELKSRFPETSSLDIPVIGEMRVHISKVDLDSFRFMEGKIFSKFSLDLEVHPVWPNLKIPIDGTLDVEMEIQMHLHDSEFIRSEVIITEFDWKTGPSLNIWNRKFNLWLIKKITESKKSNIGQAVDKLINNFLVPTTLAMHIAQQLRPVRISEHLAAHMSEIELNLHSLEIGSSTLRISGEIDATIDIVKDLVRIGQCDVKLGHQLPGQHDDSMDVHVTLEEVNEVLEAFVDDLNQEVFHSKNLISSISLAIHAKSIRVIMVPVRMKHSRLCMTMAFELEEELQQLNLYDIKVRTNEDAGFVVKALTYTLRGTIEKMVKKKFPLDMSPLLRRMSDAVESEGPESLHIKVDPLLIKALRYADDKIEATFQMRVRMSTEHCQKK